MRVTARFPLLLWCCSATLLAADFSTVRPVTLSRDQRQRLETWLASQESSYDPAAAMLQAPFSSPGYHTTLTDGMVHRTRESLTYALALLDSGNEPHRERAVAILRKVISLQDADPASKTYGIWSWFLEEPLARMSPPDWNWADFCGVSLLQVAREHRTRLPPDLVSALDAAIVHAATAIMRRNVGPDYTNIALMGTYVTRLAGEHYNCADLREYGAQRLRRFQQRTREIGGFAEYNSPTYTLIALEEIGRMRRDFSDPGLRAILDELYDAAWEEIALHFHVPTQQWAGPHSRAYASLAPGSLHAFLAEATNGRFVPAAPASGSGREYRLALPCPAAFTTYFTEPRPRTVVRTYNRGEPDTIGTTAMTAQWALGTVNRADFWNQRRPLIAYFGDARQPAFVRVRVLRDGYDFAAAQVRTVQRDGRVLAGVSFATDGGVTHVSLDRMRNATFAARDLRVRFELGGSAAGPTQPVPAAPTSVSAPLELERGGVKLRFAAPFATFGDHRVRWETSRSENEGSRDGPTVQADLVLHAGTSVEFDLGQMQRAAAVLAFEIAEDLGAAAVADIQITGDRAHARWSELELDVPLRPAKARDLRR